MSNAVRSGGESVDESSDDGGWSLTLGPEGTAAVVTVVEWSFLRVTTGEKDEVEGSVGCGSVEHERVSDTWWEEERWAGGSAG